MRPIHATTLLLCTAVAAWPSYLQPAELIERGRQLLEARQTTKTSYNLSYSATQGQITSAASATATSTQTGSTTSSTGSYATTTAKTNSTATTTTQTTFDAKDGTGGISMISPNPTSGSTYYKIHDYITFGWNYTSVSILPTGIDILAVASNTNVQHTWTLAVNQTVTASTQLFTWDTGDYQATATDPLLTASYTLLVHDAALDVSATASPGYLGLSNNFHFAMYIPQSSAAFAGIQCLTCSAASSSVGKQAFSVVLGMAAVTILSFTWFAGAAGLI